MNWYGFNQTWKDNDIHESLMSIIDLVACVEKDSEANKCPNIIIHGG